MNNTVTNTWLQVFKTIGNINIVAVICCEGEHSCADKHLFYYFSYIIDLGLQNQDLQYEIKLKILPQLFQLF